MCGGDQASEAIVVSSLIVRVALANSNPGIASKAATDECGWVAISGDAMPRTRHDYFRKLPGSRVDRYLNAHPIPNKGMETPIRPASSITKFISVGLCKKLWEQGPNLICWVYLHGCYSDRNYTKHRGITLFRAQINTSPMKMYYL